MKVSSSSYFSSSQRHGSSSEVFGWTDVLVSVTDTGSGGMRLASSLRLFRLLRVVRSIRGIKVLAGAGGAAGSGANQGLFSGGWWWGLLDAGISNQHWRRIRCYLMLHETSWPFAGGISKLPCNWTDAGNESWLYTVAHQKSDVTWCYVRPPGHLEGTDLAVMLWNYYSGWEYQHAPGHH